MHSPLWHTQHVVLSFSREELFQPVAYLVLGGSERVAMGEGGPVRQFLLQNKQTHKGITVPFYLRSSRSNARIMVWWSFKGTLSAQKALQNSRPSLCILLYGTHNTSSYPFNNERNYFNLLPTWCLEGRKGLLRGKGAS